MCVPLSFAEHHSGNEKRHPPFCPCLPRAIEKILWHTVVRNMTPLSGRVLLEAFFAKVA